MKRLINFAILIFILFTITQTIYAKNVNFTVNLSSDTAYRSEQILVNISATADSELNIAAYRAFIHFDNSKLEFKGIVPSNTSSKSDFKYHLDGDTLTIIYLSINNFQHFYANDVKNLFSLKFNVLEDSDFGSTSVYCDFDGLSDYNVDALDFQIDNNITFNIDEKPMPDCSLKSLSVSHGSFYPDFTPDNTEYFLTVPYEINKIETYAEPNDPNATIKVSRKNLRKAGTSTIITITVTSSDKKSKEYYKIIVDREEKSLSSLSKSSSKSPSSKSSSRSTSRKSAPHNNIKDSTSSSNDNDTYLNDSRNPSKNIIIKKNTFNTFIITLLSILALGLICYFIILKVNKQKSNQKYKK